MVTTSYRNIESMDKSYLLIFGNVVRVKMALLTKQSKKEAGA